MKEVNVNGVYVKRNWQMRVLRFYVPFDTQIDHFRDVLSIQSLSTVQKKLNLTQLQKQTCINKPNDTNEHKDLNPSLVTFNNDQAANRLGLFLQPQDHTRLTGERKGHHSVK